MKGNSVRNWYKQVPEALKPKARNPGYKNHLLNVPFRVHICGNSGSMKTNTLLEIIWRCNDTFGTVTVCTKNADEPLYNFLRTKIKPEQLKVYEGISQVPSLDSYDKDFQHLVVFDDLVLEKQQAKIEEYFVRGRKLGISCCYLSQSYFKTPKVIRLNVNYVILKKLSSVRDLRYLMSDFSLGVDRDVLVDLYKEVTANKEDFLMVDIDAEPDKRFRKNFLQIISLPSKEVNG